jgi:hypothetical protein
MPDGQAIAICAWVRCEGRLGLVDHSMSGNCQTDRQSSVTVVMVGAPQADQFGGDGVDGVAPDDRRLPGTERPAEPLVTAGPACDPW